jgi:hypothetical protein
MADVEYKTARGSWGDFHELGHNHQRGWWTFSGDGEVTVNIFSALCMRTLASDNPESWAWTVDPVQVMREAIENIQLANTYSEIGTLGYTLAFWLQLADGFGWETMKGVFREYEIDNLNNPSALPTNGQQEEKDQWLVRYSTATGHDLTQFMKYAWGLEVSDSAVNATSDLELPTWMPAMVSVLLHLACKFVPSSSSLNLSIISTTKGRHHISYGEVQQKPVV